METEVISKVKKPGRKRLPKLLIIAGVLVILGAAAAFILPRTGVWGKKAMVAQRTAAVGKKDLSITVTGSGSIQSSNVDGVTPEVSGKLTRVYFKEGDTVKKGDLLFEIDDSDAQLNVEKIQNSIAQAELTAGTNAKNLTGLVLKAPFNGRVTGVNSKVGDEIGKGAAIFTITNTSQLKVTIPFSSADIGQISVGQSATVNIQDIMESVDGKVTYKSTSSYISDQGGEVCDVEIAISNPGSLKDKMVASAEISTSSGTVNGAYTGTLEYADSQVMKSSAGGTVTSVNIKENQTVTAGSVLMVLQNDDLEVSSQTSSLNIENLQAQLKSAQDALSSYKIRSAIDGVIVSQDVSVGDGVGPQNSIATITNVNSMEFSIDIDELDIAKIKAGQRVNITIDALADTETAPLTGEVTKVAIEGTSSNGVTTYPVTIKINETEKLKVGMNANAEIVIESKTDALVVPLEAVTTMGKRSFVWVRGSDSDNKAAGNSNGGSNNGSGSNSNAGSGSNNSNNAWGRNRSSTGSFSAGSPGASGTSGISGSGSGTSRNTGNWSRSGNSALSAKQKTAMSYYTGAVMAPVQLGLNNDEYVEITSGLSEGDVVILPQLSSASGSSSSTASGGMGIGLGGFGGFGGPEGGGNFSRNGNSSSNRNSGSSQYRN